MKRIYLIIRKYLDPVFYYVLRPIRVVIAYFAFLGIAETATMRLPFGDPESWDYSPWKYHLCCTVSNLVVFVFIAGIFILYDATARRRFCRKPTVEKHCFSEHLGILRSWEFLSLALGLMILPFFDGLEAFVHPLYLIVPLAELGKMSVYLLYLLCVFPLMLLVLLAFHMRTRTYWRTLDEEEANAVCWDILKLFLLLMIVALGYGFLASLYLQILPFIALFLLSWIRSPFFWLAVVLIVFLVMFGRRLRAVYRQKRFLRRLQKLCAKESIALSEIRHPYRSIFRYDAEPNFTLTLHDKTYAVKLFPALSKSAEMTFVDETTGYFKRSIRIRKNELFSSRRRFRYDFDAEGAEQKILLVLPAPLSIQVAETTEVFTDKNVTYVKEQGRFHKIYDASRLFDMILYSGQAFLHALERDSLHLSD